MKLFDDRQTLVLFVEELSLLKIGAQIIPKVENNNFNLGDVKSGNSLIYFFSKNIWIFNNILMISDNIWYMLLYRTLSDNLGRYLT